MKLTYRAIGTRVGAAAMVLAVMTACGRDDPEKSQQVDVDSEQGTISGEDCADDPSLTGDLSECEVRPGAYTPRASDPHNDDAWPACVSDDNTYVLADTSPSSAARVAAYDAIGALLWNNPQVPTKEDFTDARVMLDADEGLGSRLDRRYDVHYDPPASGDQCDEAGVADAYPDYCVGPAVLRPICNEAFADVLDGDADPIVAAARIHAALQWFLYVSVVKEAITCTEKAKDCDSAWAYYSGGNPRETPIGLGKEIEERSLETHHRAFDGILAVRCWRDLDPGQLEETAIDLEMRDRAVDQLDTALIHGMATIIKQAFNKVACASGSYRAAAWAQLKVSMPLFVRAARERDVDGADYLLEMVQGSVDDSDVDAAIAMLDDLFPCP